jgi:hypothetical protein
VFSGGDLANFIGIDINRIYAKPIFKNTCQPRKQPANAAGSTPYTLICDTQKLNGVIFKDSFFEALQPHFARKFNRSTYIKGKLDYPSLVKYIAHKSSIFCNSGCIFPGNNFSISVTIQLLKIIET